METRLAWTWKLQNAGEIPQLEIYDEIGEWAYGPVDLKADLAKVKGGRLRVSIYSVGGDPFAALAIYSLLRESRLHVEVHILLACSAASVLAMAGDRITIAATGMLMIHEVSAFMGWSDSEELRRAIQTTEAASNAIAGCYVMKAGGSIETWRARMKAETWFDAQQALDAGLVDAIETAAAPLAAQVGLALRARQRDQIKIAAQVAARWLVDLIDEQVPLSVAASADVQALAHRPRRNWLAGGRGQSP